MEFIVLILALTVILLGVQVGKLSREVRDARGIYDTIDERFSQHRSEINDLDTLHAVLREHVRTNNETVTRHINEMMTQHDRAYERGRLVLDYLGVEYLPAKSVNVPAILVPSIRALRKNSHDFYGTGCVEVGSAVNMSPDRQTAREFVGKEEQKPAKTTRKRSR